MSIPIKPAWEILPKAVNTSVDLLQEGLDAVSEMVDRIQGQQPGPNDAVLGGIEGRVKRIESDLLKAKNIANEALKKANQALRLTKDIPLGVQAQIDTLKFLVGKLKIDVESIKASLPVIIKSILGSIIASAILNGLIDLGMGLLLKGGKIDLSPIFKGIQEAKDDARAASTIAVKAEGKADKALGRADAALENIKYIEKTALAAMKRLENFTKSEIKFLTDATKSALLRLQNRIINLEKLVGDIKTSFNSQIKNINATIQKINTDILKAIQKINIDLLQTIGTVKADLLTRIGKIELDIGKLFADALKVSGQIAAILLTIAGINALIGKLKGGSVNIVNNNYYTSNTTNITQVTPDNGLLKKIDATTTANLVVSSGNRSILGTVNTKLGAQIVNGLSGWMNRFTSWSVVGRVIDLMTLAATIHNATMLSSSIGQTLIQSIQNVVNFIGLKDSENNIYNVSDLIGNSINGFLALIVGADNVAGLKTYWNNVNRIYQAAGNLFSSLLDMADTTLSALQVIAGQNAKIGNALRNAGEVFENAYGWFNPTPNFSNPLLTKLNNLEETASVVENVTQQPLNVKSAKEDLEQSAANLADSLSQKPGAPQGKEVPEAQKEKADFEAGKAASEGKDVDPSDKSEDDS